MHPDGGTFAAQLPGSRGDLGDPDAVPPHDRPSPSSTTRLWRLLDPTPLKFELNAS